MPDVENYINEITILAMAAVTLVTRLAGIWVIGRFDMRGRLKQALEVMPGAVLLSIVVPATLATGPAETIAALFTAILALRAPLPLAVLGGVLSVLLLRQYFGL